MNSRTKNKLLCIGTKIDYVIGVVEDAIKELENDLTGLDDSELEARKDLQRQLNACGNTLRNLQLAKNSGDSIFEL